MKKMMFFFVVSLTVVFLSVPVFGQDDAKNSDSSAPVFSGYADVLEVTPDVQGTVTEEITISSGDESRTRTVKVTPCKGFSQTRPILVIHPWIVFIERTGELRGAAKFVSEMEKLGLLDGDREISWPSTLHSVSYDSGTHETVAKFKISFFPDKLGNVVLQDMVMNKAALRERISSTTGLSTSDGIPDVSRLEVAPMPVDPKASTIIVTYEDTGVKRQIGQASFDASFDFLSDDPISVIFDKPEYLLQLIENPSCVSFEMQYGYKGAIGNSIRNEISFKRLEFQKMLQEKFSDGKNGEKWISQKERDILEAEVKDNLHNYVSYDRNVEDGGASDAFLNQVLKTFLEQQTSFINLMTEQIKVEDLGNEQERIALAEYLKPTVVDTTKDWLQSQGETSEEVERKVNVEINSSTDTSGGSVGASVSVPIYCVSVGFSGGYETQETESHLEELRKELEKQLSKYLSVTNSSTEGRIEYEIKNINLYRLREQAFQHVGQRISETAYYHKLSGRQTTASFPLWFTTEVFEQVEVNESFNLFQEKLKTVEELERKSKENLELFNEIIKGLNK